MPKEKPIYLTVRVTQEEKTAFFKAAKSKAVNPSEWVRQQVLKYTQDATKAK